MDTTKIDQTGNKLELIPNGESLLILDIPDIDMSLEAQKIELDYRLKNKMLDRQYEIEGLKLNLENKKLDYENQQIIDDRKERKTQFFTIIFLVVFVLTILSLLFLLLIYSGKYEVLFEVIKSKRLSTVFSLFTLLLSLLGSGSWIKQKIDKWRKV